MTFSGRPTNRIGRVFQPRFLNTAGAQVKEHGWYIVLGDRMKIKGMYGNQCFPTYTCIASKLFRLYIPIHSHVACRVRVWCTYHLSNSYHLGMRPIGPHRDASDSFSTLRDTWCVQKPSAFLRLKALLFFVQKRWKQWRTQKYHRFTCKTLFFTLLGSFYTMFTTTLTHMLLHML